MNQKTIATGAFIHETDRTKVAEHYKSELAKSIETLFNEMPLSRIYSTINFLVYYSMYPDLSKGLEKKEIVDLFSEVVLISSLFSTVYCSYVDYSQSKVEEAA